MAICQYASEVSLTFFIWYRIDFIVYEVIGKPPVDLTGNGFSRKVSYLILHIFEQGGRTTVDVPNVSWGYSFNALLCKDCLNHG